MNFVTKVNNICIVIVDAYFAFISLLFMKHILLFFLMTWLFLFSTVYSEYTIDEVSNSLLREWKLVGDYEGTIPILLSNYFDWIDNFYWLFFDWKYLYHIWRKMKFFDGENISLMKLTNDTWKESGEWITDNVFVIISWFDRYYITFTDEINQLIDEKFMQQIVPQHSKESIKNTIKVLQSKIPQENPDDLFDVLSWLYSWSRSAAIQDVFYGYILRNLDTYYN